MTTFSDTARTGPSSPREPRRRGASLRDALRGTSGSTALTILACSLVALAATYLTGTWGGPLNTFAQPVPLGGHRRLPRDPTRNF